MRRNQPPAKNYSSNPTVGNYFFPKKEKDKPKLQKAAARKLSKFKNQEQEVE